MMEDDSSGQREFDVSAYQGDWTLVARYLSPTEAYMLCAYLNAGGVPARADDVELMQAHSLLAGAVGGASVRVPLNFVAEAEAVMEAYKQGAFEIDEDFDVDEKPAADA